MQTYHIETTMTNDGILVINGLPFRVGEKIEVIRHRRKPEKSSKEKYPFRGKLIRYAGPFASVAEKDWDVLHGKILQYPHINAIS